MATLHHPVRGIKALPGNWLRILWAIDSRHAPKLLPGLPPKVWNLSLSYWMEAFRAGGKYRLIAILTIPIWFLPALLYRWSLKSTC
ncbi:MAG: hypothetical protein BECKG1743D_GA0114223_110203 [Candidatus Kentron sp. G]|nr:MAG: hypothetical protein BECKG1743F_GA0114225_108322 [Candidatus Kentron sp. G]VFN06252.1 MAG: hypothetical protein BECKG1743E_GA0114224_109872 [Candidatus Kentron sp. G]VFN07255.1 MAG: hypothetical protein BECKG1743D_GA0114223_110203 [Candidatus Kentron sp. G]